LTYFVCESFRILSEKETSEELDTVLGELLAGSCRGMPINGSRRLRWRSFV
jgi:hypothetical protein